MAKKAVQVRSLNFRKRPGTGSAIIKSLRMGKKVEILGDAEEPGWKHVRVKVGGERKKGFVHGAFLRDLVSPAREDLMNIAIKEWIRFDRGAGKEHRHPYFEFVGEMWQMIGRDLDGKDREVPWSAACISYFVRKAADSHPDYGDFRFAAAHARYIHQSIQRKLTQEDGPYWGFRRTEKAPELGDLVCQWRVRRRTYDFARDHDAFASHTDLVVAVNEDSVTTIGGNVGHSVKMKTYRLNSNGLLRNERKVFALMKNNL